MALAGKHSWTAEGVRHERHTDRACYACGLIKRTRHEGGRHWIEFWRPSSDASASAVRDASGRYLERIPGKHTPPCPGSPNQQGLSFTPPRNVITNGDSYEADH